MKNILKTTVFSLLLLAGVFFTLPAKAHAIDFNPFKNPLDPFCLFTDCDDPQPQQVTNTNTYDNSVNNSFNDNTNSFNGSNIALPGSTVPATQSTNTTPAYNYSGNNNTYTPTPELKASCYPVPTSIIAGDSVQWQVSAYGGNDSYHISWSGTEGLSGNGVVVNKTYYEPGTKNATVTVTSGRQLVTKNCSGTVTVRGTHSYDYPTPPYNYYPTYPTYPTYYPLSVSCRANTSYVQPGTTAYWTAYVSGGQGNYYYTWSGTDNLYGSGNTASAYYTTPGTKTAWVSVQSGGQTATAQCSNYITVQQQYYQYGQPYYQYQQPTYYQPISYGGLQVACGADTTSTKIGIPVTWSAEATLDGYTGGLSYSWTGTEGLYGSQASAVTKYSSAGTKTASVTVTSPSGQSVTRACTNSVYVSSGAKVATAKPAARPVVTPTPTLSASSIFSLQNVPWGWVAILIILVLLGLISYLIFNKKKI